MTKQIRINAFTQCSICPQSKGQWKNPADHSSTGYRDLDFWIDLAKTLERGCVDALFFADVHGVYDVFGGSMDAGIQHAVQFPGNDPTTLATVLARETRHLGFIFTLSTTYYPPFHAAKLFSSLDHFTGGRIGWNIVTSYLESAYKNGLGSHPLEHDERYDQADEYLDVVYKLWEHSWEEDAVSRDVHADVHTDPTKIHRINHKGQYYSVQGPHMCEPSPQRTPFLVQAGQSGRGTEFGAKHAEALFCGFRDIEEAKEKTRIIRDLCEANGRSRDAIKILPGVCIVCAPTEQEAQKKYREYLSYSSPEGALALFGGWTGIDLAGLEPESVLDNMESQGMQFLAQWFNSDDPNNRATLKDVMEYMSIGSLAKVVVGTPSQIADYLEAMVDEADVDGFNFIPVAQPASTLELVDLVIPELQKRGRFKTHYEGNTLRENFSCTSHPRLDPKHHAFTLSMESP